MKDIYRAYLAEFFGTAILVLLGCGVNAQVTLMGGDFISISIGWGVAIYTAVLVSNGVSGAHLNPAVSITLALFGRFPWKKVAGYSGCQTLGAFFGSLMVFALYYEEIEHIRGGLFVPPHPKASAGIFGTYRQEYVSQAAAFFDQLLGTAILMMGIFAIGDKKNANIKPEQVPQSVAFILFIIIQAFGLNCGAALNPARDFGPRLMTAMVGYGGETFSTMDYFFWIPLIAPIIGAVIGGAIYTCMIETHHAKQDLKSIDYEQETMTNTSSTSDRDSEKQEGIKQNLIKY